VRQTDALNQTTVYEYDAEDRLIRVVDPSGNTRTFAYDPLGRVTAETDGLGNSYRREYDAVGNEVAAYDAQGRRVKTAAYDSRDLPVSVQDGFGHTYTSVFDTVGRLVSLKDPLNRTSALTYDNLDRVTQVHDPMNRQFSQDYLQDDVIRRITSPRNVFTDFRYDPANRMTAVETAEVQLTTFRYNGSDSLTRESSRSGKIWNYAYDSSGRLSSISRSGLPNLLYSYDDSGNLASVRSSNMPAGGGIRRTYDQLNRLSSFTDQAGNRIDYLYDRSGNLSVLRYPDGKSVTYAYDRANRLVSITDWANRITRYAWDANGRLTSIAFPNGSSRRLTYDVAGQVTSRQDRDAQGQLIVSYRYAYDAVGQVTVEAAAAPNPPYIPAAASMTYDRDNRLATFNGQGVTFDLDGNMTRGPLGAALANFTYDFNHNLVQAGEVSYSYDLEDRLVGFSSAGGPVSLVNNPGNGFSQLLQKRTPNGATTTYVWGVGMAYEETGGQIRVYHYDQRGSTIAFTGTNGAVTGRVGYGPFGEIAERSGDTDSLFLFGGLFGVITDSQGLNYMRFRWYSPEIKRFINQDAHFGDITLPGTLNRFAYAGNSPLMRADPSGECWVCAGALTGAAVAVVAKGVGDFIDDGKLNDPWQEYAGAAIGGAVTGAIITACPTCGAFAGGAGAAADYLSAQALKGEKVDPVDLAFNTAIGAFAGAAFGAGGKGVTRPTNYRFATNGVATLVQRQVYHQLVQAGSTILTTVVLKELKERYGVSDRAERCVSSRLAECESEARGLVSQIRTDLSNLFGGPVSTGVVLTNRLLIYESSRQRVNRGKKGVYGEYIHYQRWLDGLMMAGRPVPDNPNHVLTSF
jgi:RHS repeat-associated protein